MKAKKLKPSLIYYELRNIAGNPYMLFFGVIFPVFMLFVITKSFEGSVPANMLSAANTQMFITLSMIIPLAVIFLGYASTYSQELETEIPIRMRLFGFRESTLMLAKMIAQIVALTLGLLIYTGISYLFFDLKLPQPSAAISLMICLYLLGAVLFALAHGLANLFRKFGPTFTLAMILYFLIMILCGMMGIQTEQLPKFFQSIAAMLPMSYISSDFGDFWVKGSYHFAPMIQSYLFLGAISGILILYANYRNRRGIK